MKALSTKVMTVTFTLALVSGCQTVSTQSTDPYTGEQTTSNTVKGAGIGAGVGALLGALTADDGERTERILAGAALGGAAGGGIGYYMDQQEAEMRQMMQGTGVKVERHGNQIQLVMPGNITFETASASLAPDFYRVLKGVSLVLTKYDQTLLNIDGHTDSVGAESYNMQLSQQRANTVYNNLAGQGVAASRMRATGYGESRPIADNSSEMGRTQNRRVELWIQPMSQQ